MAIVRLQGAEELEYDEACERAAMLIEEGSEQYKETMKVEANRIYKSRFLREQNKAKNSWIKKGYDDGFSDGKKAGNDIGREAYQIKYPCSKCGGDLILRPGNKDTKSAIEFLKSQGWGHSKCIEASKPSG
jgi:ssDNA-binding Zn-finger/Zn-ribbon topoisomerase 1